MGTASSFQKPARRPVAIRFLPDEMVTSLTPPKKGPAPLRAGPRDDVAGSRAFYLAAASAAFAVFTLESSRRYSEYFRNNVVNSR